MQEAKMKKHCLICEAPICRDDTTQNFESEVIWYAGELVCQKGPFQKFQLVQNDINRWVEKGKFKNLDTPYTKYELENKSI